MENYKSQQEIDTDMEQAVQEDIATRFSLDSVVFNDPGMFESILHTFNFEKDHEEVEVAPNAKISYTVYVFRHKTLPMILITAYDPYDVDMGRSTPGSIAVGSYGSVPVKPVQELQVTLMELGVVKDFAPDGRYIKAPMNKEYYEEQT